MNQETAQVTPRAQSAGLRLSNSIPCIAPTVAKVTVRAGHATALGIAPNAVKEVA
jgi:hypothetical protein